MPRFTLALQLLKVKPTVDDKISTLNFDSNSDFSLYPIRNWSFIIRNWLSGRISPSNLDKFLNGILWIAIFLLFSVAYILGQKKMRTALRY